MLLESKNLNKAYPINNNINCHPVRQSQILDALDNEKKT
jgi:hypothetical protein